MLSFILFLRSTLVSRKYRSAACCTVGFGKLSPSMLVAALFFCSAAGALASTITLDFEGFPDSTILTSQYPGLTFSNAIILTSGISLNEFEFPPHSGVNVVSDNSGPLAINFASPITSFSGYFTYVQPLTIDAFNASSTLVASATSAFSSNDALFGNLGSSPNELLQVGAAGGISRITIAGDPSGGSFVLDDATIISAVAGSSTPEPATFYLILSGGVLLWALIRRQAPADGNEADTARQSK